MLVNEKEPLTINLVHGFLKSFPSLNASWLLTGEGDMFLEKKEALPAGTLDPVVMEPDVVYGKGEGRLEWLERKVRELDERLRALEEGKGE